jgi:ribokinase
MGRVVVVGSANTDFVVRVPRLPTPGETVLGGAFATAAGGKGANQAVAAARLGAAVTFVARLGRDAWGDAALAGYAAEGIECHHLTRDEAHASGVALIVVDARGENLIAVAPGANAALRPGHVAAAEAAIREADVLLAQLEVPLETVAAAVALARRHGVRVVLNPAPAQPLPDTLVAGVVLTPNETEAARLLGEGVGPEPNRSAEAAAGRLLARGAEAVVVTLGARGALVATAAGSRPVPGFRVEAVDTTAAGDAFNGALAAALARGEALEAAVREACAAGAVAATRAGAQPSLPRPVDLRLLLEGGEA